MKKIICLFSFLLILSCSSDDDNPEVVNQEFLDQLLGTYELKAAYTNDPIDLNGDGLKSTDVFEEVVYCNMSTILESYFCKVVDRSTYQRIRFYAPSSNWSNIEQNYTHCLKHGNLASRIIIDSMKENVILNTLDYELDFMYEEHRTKILDFRWENRVVFIKQKQQKNTPTDEKETIIKKLENEMFISET